MVRQKFPDAVANGQELFDANFFYRPSNRPIFFRFIGLLKELAKKAKPTTCHKLIAHLRDFNLLTRHYTQNIDGLESKAGLCCDGFTTKETESVLLHGTLDCIKCIMCMDTQPFSDSVIEEYKKGNSVECTACLKASEARKAAGRRASAVGIYRPDIVLYNEAHAQGDEISELLAHDLAKGPDALLVVGTSLKVPGVRRMVKDIAKAVRQSNGPVIYLNKTCLPSLDWKKVFSYELVGCADFFADFLIREWIGVAKARKDTRIDSYFPLRKVLAPAEKTNK